MKKLKNGFSLAELLIAMSIIAVIATMGFTISKQGIENAYRLYFYTGYQGLYDAISGTIAGEIAPINVDGSGVSTINANFVNNIANLFDTQASFNGINYTMTARNDISYTMSLSNSTFNNNGATSSIINITMRVPQVKRRNNVQDTTEFIYLTDYEGGMLMPIANAITSDPNRFIDIQNRMDLLPFYGDNGIAGKVIRIHNTNNTMFTPRTFYSFKEAYCRRYNYQNVVLSNGTIAVDCAGIAQGNNIRGFLKAENPRKVF